MQSPLSRAVDLRGMLKCEEFTGGKETFPDWKRTLYSTVDLVNPQWAVKAKQIEKNLDQEVKLASMTTEERAEAGGFYTFLVHLCKNEAATKVAAAEEYNGYEAWRHLCRAYLARSTTVALSSLMYPKIFSPDPRVNLAAWDREAQRYEDRFQEKVPDALRMAIYQDKIAPPEVHEHLLLNKAKYPTPNALRDAITDYLEAKEQSQQNKDIEGGFVAGIHGKGKGAGKESDRHVKDTKFDKKKGKGKDKKGKGKEKGKEKGKDKGKFHKGRDLWKDEMLKAISQH